MSKRGQRVAEESRVVSGVAAAVRGSVFFLFFAVFCFLQSFCIFEVGPSRCSWLFWGCVLWASVV